ncbi:MAG: LuxR C-terminal-related transcriptional regulator [Anaerolineae bacterium]
MLTSHEHSSFVGRTQELADIQKLLADPMCRLLSLVGPGGIGKTRLALEVARAAQSAFIKGVHFVSLAPIHSATNIPSAIAHALPGLRPERYNLQGLLDYLNDQTLLLILDNFEHLLDGVEVVAAVLAAAPRVKIIVTSRESLNIQEEWLWDVAGLDFPMNDAVTPLETYSAVQLFAERAHQVRRTFSLADEYTQVVNICRIVEGMPLALELAAIWIKSLNCAEIADAISQDMNFLQTRLHNIPERHRSMRVVFEHTWDMLNEAERTALRRLSVFRGGFTQEAAARVAGTTLHTLAALVDKSILTKVASGRYAIRHELLRQYGENQLEIAGENSAISDAHSTYFTDFLAQWEPHIRGLRQEEAISHIEADFDNVRLAWFYAVEEKHYLNIDVGLEGLLWFGLRSGRSYETKMLLNQTHDGLLSVTGEEAQRVWGRVLARWLWLRMLHDSATPDDVPTTNREQASQCLNIAYHAGALTEIAFAHFVMGYSGYYREVYDEAVQHLEASLGRYRNLSNDRGAALVLLIMAFVTYRLGLQLEAISHAQESYALAKTTGDRRIHVNILGHLGIIHFFNGQYTESEHCFQQSAVLEFEFHKRIGTYKLWHISGKINRGDLEQANIQIDAECRNSDGTTYDEYGLYALSIIACIETHYVECPQLCEPVRTWVHHSPDWGAWIDSILALAACGLGDFDLARHHVLVTLHYYTRYVRSPWMLLNSVLVAAHLLENTGDKLQAVQLLALFFTHPGTAPVWKTRSPLAGRLCQKLEAELGSAAYDAAWSRGQSLDLLTTCKHLLHHLESPDKSSSEILSEREREVLELVAEGHSNRQIAAQLILSTGTVKRHVSNIGAKLGTHNRLQTVERARTLHLID